MAGNHGSGVLPAGVEKVGAAVCELRGPAPEPTDAHPNGSSAEAPYGEKVAAAVSELRGHAPEPTAAHPNGSSAEAPDGVRGNLLQEISA